MFVVNMRRRVIHSEADVRGDCHVDDIVEVARVSDYRELRRKGFRFCSKCMKGFFERKEVKHVVQGKG